MTHKQSSMQVVNTLYGIGQIASGILLRCTHIALSIHRVIITPVGGRCHRNTCLEYRTALTHTHQCAESTKAPAPDTDAVFIHVWLFAEIQGSLYLIFGFFDSDFQISAFLKSFSTASSATTIYTNNNISFLGQIIVEGSSITHTSCTPCILYLLVTRTRILELYNGIFLVGIKVYRFHHPSIQFHSLGCGERERFTLSPIIPGNLVEQLLIVLQHSYHLSTIGTRGEDIRMTVTAPSIEEITIITREYGCIVSTCIGKSFGRSVGMCHIDLSVVRTQHA